MPEHQRNTAKRPALNHFEFQNPYREHHARRFNPERNRFLSGSLAGLRIATSGASIATRGTASTSGPIQSSTYFLVTQSHNSVIIADPGQRQKPFLATRGGLFSIRALHQNVFPTSWSKTACTWIRDQAQGQNSFENPTRVPTLEIVNPQFFCFAWCLFS